MTIKIVVMGRSALPEGVEFPLLEAARYSWEEYLQLTRQDLVDRCWRADVVVILGGGIRIDGELLDKLGRLKLLIIPTSAMVQIGREVAAARGIVLREHSEGEDRDIGSAQALCTRISALIDAWLSDSCATGSPS